MKRFLDILFSLFCLFVFLFPLIFVSLLIYHKLGRPIFFTQLRAGLHGRPFRIVKFRTMTDQCDEHGSLLPDLERITPFGSWLRSTSIDELPELYNILCGEMSFIGPRPLLMQYLPLYSPLQARRHEVRPGITGWAQINGRNNISWEDKFRLDVWYVDHRNLVMDIKIFVLTIWKVLHRKDINPSGQATVSYFHGSASK